MKTHEHNSRQISSNELTSPRHEPQLVGLKTALEMVFPCDKTRPCFRTFCEWRRLKFYPTVKIGKRVFADPHQVRKALEKRFTIEAID